MAKGPPPGTHHAGTFKPGHDPRRNVEGPRQGGDLKAVRDHARQYSIEALEFLVSLMRDERANVAARSKAADLVLDRAVGKATVRVGDDPEVPIGTGARAILRDVLTGMFERSEAAKEPPGSGG